MCWLLYGSVNPDVNEKDFAALPQNGTFRFIPGGAEDVARCVEACAGTYRLTRRHCDRDTAVGLHDASAPELAELAETVGRLRSLRGAKYALLLKNWSGEKYTAAQTVHIDDVDLPAFLAELPDDRLCRLDLYKRY